MRKAVYFSMKSVTDTSDVQIVDLVYAIGTVINGSEKLTKIF